jgi:tRNA nucleotidyltransferase (CCA-adding enzyme)
VELAGDFKAFLSSLQPGDTDIAAAKAAHEKVREELRTDDESKEAHKDTFLSGSYARSTAINDINDVDVICVLDLDHRITEPEVCLAWIQAILARHYKETKRQGRSVGASAAKGVWLDIVPATPVSADDGPLWILPARGNIWIRSG